MKLMDKLKFSPANSKLKKLEKKLGKKVYSFDLSAGHTCRYAKLCYSKAIESPEGLRIQDGKETEFRCYAASQEVLYKNVYLSRKYNTDLIKSCGNNIKKIEELIGEALPSRADYIRLHSSGDFLTLNYFIAWMNVARKNPNKTFYAYTKSLPFWIHEKDNIPENFILTASYGGKADDLIEKHNLRYAKVVYSAYEAKKLKLPIDFDDSHAATKSGNFTLLIHGQGIKNSRHSKAVARLNKNKRKNKNEIPINI